MTYDEWEKSQSSPYSVGGIQYGANSTPLPPPPTMGGFLSGPAGLGNTVYNAFRRAQDFLQPRATTNRSFSPMQGGLPSFTVPSGEQPALQMPGVSRDKFRRLISYLGYNDPPGFRDMPRYGYPPYIQERNTEFIPGPPRPESTPYPWPTFMTPSHYFETGERGPLPLNWRRQGSYPAPANTPMPEAYDTLTSGGALA